MCCDSPSPPDYTPVAEASEESARIMAELGQEQLAFAEKQYAENKPLYDKLVQQQLEIGDQSKFQAEDYYDYMVENQRPVEDALNKEAMAAGSEAAQEEAAGRAMADARTGYTGALGTAMREGSRYGYSADKMAKAAGSSALGYASMTAAGANTAREREKDKGYAKKLDVAGLYRGLPGASSGAYSVALNAGNSAGANAGQAGAQYQAGVAQGVNTIGSGRQMYQGGLQGVLNAQTSVYNSDQSNNLDVGGLMSGGAQLYKAFSDRRLKENIEAVGVDEATGLTLYEFNYINDDRRFRGVMADEVEKVMPAAVLLDERGYRLVDYGLLGIEMKEVTCA